MMIEICVCILVCVQNVFHRFVCQPYSRFTFNLSPFNLESHSSGRLYILRFHSLDFPEHQCMRDAHCHGICLCLYIYIKGTRVASTISAPLASSVTLTFSLSIKWFGVPLFLAVTSQIEFFYLIRCMCYVSCYTMGRIGIIIPKFLLLLVEAMCCCRL